MKNLEKLNLGELISELLETHYTLKWQENISKRKQLKEYENKIYEQLNKREEKYNSYKNPPLLK